MFCIVLYSVYVLANQVPLHAGVKRFHLQTSLIRDNNETAVMAPQKVLAKAKIVSNLHFGEAAPQKLRRWDPQRSQLEKLGLRF